MKRRNPIKGTTPMESKKTDVRKAVPAAIRDKEQKMMGLNV